jgi:hypothetical protein
MDSGEPEDRDNSREVETVQAVPREETKSRVIPAVKLPETSGLL